MKVPARLGHYRSSTCALPLPQPVLARLGHYWSSMCALPLPQPRHHWGGSQLCDPLRPSLAALSKFIVQFYWFKKYELKLKSGCTLWMKFDSTIFWQTSCWITTLNHYTWSLPIVTMTDHPRVTKMYLFLTWNRKIVMMWLLEFW